MMSSLSSPSFATSRSSCLCLVLLFLCCNLYLTCCIIPQIIWKVLSFMIITFLLYFFFLLLTLCFNISRSFIVSTVTLTLCRDSSLSFCYCLLLSWICLSSRILLAIPCVHFCTWRCHIILCIPLVWLTCSSWGGSLWFFALFVDVFTSIFHCFPLYFKYFIYLCHFFRKYSFYCCNDWFPKCFYCVKFWLWKNRISYLFIVIFSFQIYHILYKCVFSY